MTKRVLIRIIPALLAVGSLIALSGCAQLQDKVKDKSLQDKIKEMVGGGGGSTSGSGMVMKIGGGCKGITLVAGQRLAEGCARHGAKDSPQNNSCRTNSMTAACVQVNKKNDKCMSKCLGDAAIKMSRF